LSGKTIHRRRERYPSALARCWTYTEVGLNWKLHLQNAIQLCEPKMLLEKYPADGSDSRAVTKSREPGILPGYYKSGPRLLLNKTKILHKRKMHQTTKL